ncbi:XRE family transcriptional regulator [Vibrio sp. JC009]|uniref:helix-turn-helix domain-containing protein n=1 Tax=Vibrio sp. JC009 TaxID=2912314 RepID=UPI0023B117F1|nr:XRE family transcriptional regulator [Vibrio sp. JC009]WED22543.1 XRE family transcriptional regulator [Vibrio sp. JC009]
MEDFSILGENLKSIRNKRGLSLSEASSLTGVSKTMLSQIERSESMPTIATVWKIANGLKIKLESLLDNPNPCSTYDVKNIKDMIPVEDDNGRMIIYSIFPFSPTSGYEVVYAVFKPGCSYTDPTSHENSTTEQIFVHQGTLDLIVGKKTYAINEGSSITFDSKDAHTYTNTGDTDVNALIIVNYD